MATPVNSKIPGGDPCPQRDPEARQIEQADALKKLARESASLRKQLTAGRRGLDAVMERLARLRRNPLTRPFVRAALVEEIRDVKRALAPPPRIQQMDGGRLALERKYPGLTDPWAIRHGADLKERRLRVPRVEIGPARVRPRLNMLFPDLDPRIMYGGYIAAFEFLASLQAAVEVRLVTTRYASPDLAALAAKFDANPRVRALFARAEYADLSTRDSILPVARGDVFCGYSFWDCFFAHELARATGAEQILYFCQEDETIFHDYSASHALGRHAQALPHFAIFNTELLRDYFRAKRLGVYARGVEAGDAGSIAFQHALVPVGPSTLEEYRTRTRTRVLCYSRPEAHARRNLFELSLLALGEFTRLRSIAAGDVEFAGIGSLQFEGDVPLGDGHILRIRPRLDLGDYAGALARHDIGLSLMYAPHPSILPFEMASAGLLTVTNTFDNRDEATLVGISTNLVPAKPEVHSIARALAEAWDRHRDYPARIQGSRFAWSRSWEQTFDERFRETILRVITSTAGL